jgi:uncharacterized protein
MSYTAFRNNQQIAAGDLHEIARQVPKDSQGQILIFDDDTGSQIDLDLRGTPEPRPAGRPKLGVVAREVTLLPRHWDWLATQPGGASVALRKLVEQARRTNQDADRRRQAIEATYRFITAMAGNEPGFEEANRALFAANSEKFRETTELWPIDVREHARRLAATGFETPLGV